MVRTSFAQVAAAQPSRRKDTTISGELWTLEDSRGDEASSAQDTDPVAMSKQAIFDKWGIDVRDQEKTESGRKVWTAEIKAQVLKALEESLVSHKELAQHIGVHSSQITIWRREAASGSLEPKKKRGSSSGGAAAPNGKGEDASSTDADLLTAASTARTAIKDHASKIAAAQLEKRRKGRQVPTAALAGNVSFQAHTVDQAIKILELMRDNTDVEGISISLVVAE